MVRRKPFVMQGLPPMITMRVDDVDGTRSYYLDNLRWLEISNEYGFIPWCVTFIDNVGTGFFTKLSELVNAGRATAIPHALTYDNFIYCNQQNLRVLTLSQISPMPGIHCSEFHPGF